MGPLFTIVTFTAICSPMVADDCSDPSIMTTQGVCVIQFIHETDRKLFEDSMSFAGKQVKHLVETYPDLYPMYTNGGPLET